MNLLSFEVRIHNNKDDDFFTSSYENEASYVKIRFVYHIYLLICELNFSNM
jgi:hypothetical protein